MNQQQLCVLLPQSEYNQITNEIREIKDLLLSKVLQGSTPKPIYLKKKEAADFIKTTPEALQQMVTRGRIQSIKRGRSLYFLESDLIEWLEQGRRGRNEERVSDPTDGLKPLRRKAGSK